MTHPSVSRSLPLLLALALGACGPAPSSRDEATSAGSSGGEAQPTSGQATASAGEASDVGALLVDVVVPRICDSLRGSFVGLPGEGGRPGPQAGLDPTTGRWWIRECSAREHGGRLELAIAGTGWTWVDRESMGFRVRQYLRFDASASFTSSMEMSYDRPNRVVTIWLRPEGEVRAEVRPRGLVEAQATGVLSGVLGGLLELGGSSPNDQARQLAADEGSARLRTQFATGFTVTYALTEDQMDFMVGALERGQRPERPFPPEPGVVWSVNQRLALWPSGLDVIGPIATAGAPQSLEVELEEGPAILVDAVCATDFESYYDRMLQGGGGAPPTGARLIEIGQIGRRERAIIPTQSCPTLLLASTRSDATLPVRARLRVFTGAASSAATSAPASGASGSDPTRAASAGQAAAPSPRPIRIRLASLSVSPTTATGGRWDMIGGEPDPFILIVSVPSEREIERTPVVSDQHEITLDHWLPGAFRVEDLPIRFVVYDDDVGPDDLIGVAELSAERALAAGSSELVLELRTTGDVPRTMGALRVVLQRLD